MAKFTIAGKTYEAKSQVEAWKMHQDAQASGGAPKTTVPQAKATPGKLSSNPIKPVQGPTPVKPAAPVKTPATATAPPKTEVAAASGPATAFEMVCYRGEKKEWWRPPEERLIYGMTVYGPWNVDCKNMTELWERLRSEINKSSFGNVPAFAQYLRAQGRPFAVATARTKDGAYTYDYNYVIKIPNARAFLWGPKLTLGPQVNFSKPGNGVTADYIVLNANTIAESTVLGFGHKCGTYEVTFVHDVPLRFIDSCNDKAISGYTIKKEAELGMQQKIDLRKYLRRSQSWLT
jgi:hypothetical protein